MSRHLFGELEMIVFQHAPNFLIERFQTHFLVPSVLMRLRHAHLILKCSFAEAVWQQSPLLSGMIVGYLLILISLMQWKLF